MYELTFKHTIGIGVGRVLDPYQVPGMCISGVICERDRDGDYGIAIALFGYGIAFGYSPDGNYQ